MMNNIYMLLLIIAIVSFFNSTKCFSQKGSSANEVYDLVSLHNLEIDCDLTSDKVKGDAKLSKVILNAQATDYSAPSLTFRFGVAENLEYQVITGYRAVVLSEKLGTVKRNGKTLTIDKNISGLSELTMGIKYGICPEKYLRPSIAITSLITLPNVGNPAFSSEKLGAELDLNFFKTLSEYSDVSYDLGLNFDGFETDPFPFWNYRLAPEVFTSDNLSLFIESNGYYSKRASSINKLDLGIYYSFSDFVDSYFFLGTILNSPKNSFFWGANLSITVLH